MEKTKTKKTYDFKGGLKKIDEEVKKKGIKFTMEEAVKNDLYD